ncbi:hypothetical protein PAXRUDRAFT_502762 [Paxillus rubicundulus Ve08.2h10]|uniref:Uncharacterized protein n=1 Tax=Paxillus rubicundulus Ve08.2h10 TaxID=930991 RepID=A0A0D0D9D2_9AGAM|nr:hypothetical protein PAXRUDRAFT_502762 [Paxillus rubicundulus Ve08.2h10]
MPASVCTRLETHPHTTAKLVQHGKLVPVRHAMVLSEPSLIGTILDLLPSGEGPLRHETPFGLGSLILRITGYYREKKMIVQPYCQITLRHEISTLFSPATTSRVKQGCSLAATRGR